MPDISRQHADWLRRLPVAHRGLHDAQRPENSLGAFDAAAEAGYAIELDVRVSKDGQLIVIHDANAERMTGANRAVTKTDAEILTNLHLRGTAYRIPLLEQALSTIAARVPVLIEIKYPTPARVVGPELLKQLTDYQGQFAVEAFDPRVVSWLRRHAPHILRGQNAGTLPEYTHYPRWYRRLLCAMLLNWWARPQFIALDVRDYPRPSARFWRRILGVPLLLWTVRTSSQLALAEADDCNIIFESMRPPIK